MVSRLLERWQTFPFPLGHAVIITIRSVINFFSIFICHHSLFNVCVHPLWFPVKIKACMHPVMMLQLSASALPPLVAYVATEKEKKGLDRFLRGPCRRSFIY